LRVDHADEEDVMILKAGLAGFAALFLTAAIAGAQTTGPASDRAAAPGDRAAPYSASDANPPASPANTAPMRSSRSATAHGSDSAAQTQGSTEEKAIARCQALSPVEAEKDATCAALTKKHPTMLNGPQ
jgi:hypothetical protein